MMDGFTEEDAAEYEAMAQRAIAAAEQSTAKASAKDVSLVRNES